MFAFSETGYTEDEDCEMFLSGKAQIPSALVPVDRAPSEGEDQQHLSGLGPSLWEKELDVCLFLKRVC